VFAKNQAIPFPEIEHYHFV